MLNLLVTGGCGFIGSNFIRYALQTQDDLSITNLDKLSYGSNLKSLEDVGGQRYKFVKGDVADANFMSDLVNSTDAIVNFAAESHVDRSIAGPWTFFESNAKGVITILELLRAARRNIRLIQVSTDEVYGSVPRGSAREIAAILPSSPYSASKATGDAFCLAYFRTYGVNVSICRCTNNFGPYQFPEKLIPKAIIRAKLDLKVPIYGTGKNVRDWIYVLDHCEALVQVLRAGKAGDIYNIAGGNEASNLDVVTRILEILGRPTDLIELVEDRPGHDERYSLNSGKIKKELGWRPKHKFNEALEKTVHWYSNNESWWRELVSDSIIHSSPWKISW